MNVLAWLLFGFAATVLLTVLMAGSQALNLTRMNMPYLVGTILTGDRNRAKIYGFFFHLLNGWVFSLLYLLAFELSGRGGILFGAAIGAVHALFVLTVALPAMPAWHPRVASETQGPSVTQALEPPGFLGRHYGVRTPISIFFAHLVFGATLGLLYPLS